MFRLGRLLPGGARGPGVFFIIPCVDIYEKIDMRTQTFDVPPQEVNIIRKDFFSSQEWDLLCEPPCKGALKNYRDSNKGEAGEGVNNNSICSININKSLFRS